MILSAAEVASDKYLMFDSAVPSALRGSIVNGVGV
jgi:hypothetical protein